MSCGKEVRRHRITEDIFKYVARFIGAGGYYDGRIDVLNYTRSRENEDELNKIIQDEQLEENAILYKNAEAIRSLLNIGDNLISIDTDTMEIIEYDKKKDGNKMFRSKIDGGKRIVVEK